jgi:hypothetical protein
MFTKNEDVGSIKISFYGASDGVSLLAFRDEARFYRNETFCRIMYLFVALCTCNARGAKSNYHSQFMTFEKSPT